MEGANIHSVIKNPPDVVSLAALHEDAETLKLVPGQMQEINGCLSSNEFLLEPPLQTCFAPQPPAAAAVIAEPAEATDDESDQMDNQADDVCLLEFETKESTADCVALKKVVSNHDAEQSLASSTPIVFRVSEQFKPKMRLDFNKSETLEPAPMEIEKCRATNVEPSTSKVQNQKKLKFTEPPFHILRTNPAVLPVTSKQLVSSPIKPSDNKFEFEINDDESFCFESWFRKDKVVNKEPDKERKKSVVNEKELAKKGKTRKKGAVQEKVAVQPGLHPTGKHSGSKKRKASEDNNPGATQKVPASRQLNYNKRNEQQEKEEEGNEPLPRSKRLLTPIRTTKMGERKRAEQGKTSAMAMTKVVEELEEEPSCSVEEKANKAKISQKTPQRLPASGNVAKARCGKQPGTVSGDYGPSNRAQSKSIPLAESEASEGGNDDENDQVVELENRKKYVISGKSSSTPSRNPITIKSKRPAVTPPPSKHTVFRTSTPISNESECEMWEDPKSSCSESHVRKGKVISRKPVKQGKNSSVPKKRGRPRKHPEKTAVAMPEVEDQEKLQEEPRVYVKKANQAKKLKETIENSKRQLASRGSVNCPTDRSKKRSGRAPSAETRTQNTKTSAKMKQTDTKKTERTQSGYLTKQINPSVFHEDDFHSISDLHPDSDETYTISGRHIRPPNQWWKVAQQDYSPPVSSRREAKSSRHSSWLPPSQNKIKHRAGKSSAQKTKIYNLSKRDSSSAQIKSVVPQPLSSDEDADFAGDELDYDDDSISVFYDIQSQPAVQYENDTISGALTAQSGKHLFKSSVPRKRAFPELAKDQENPSALYPATKRPKRCPQSLDKLNENRIKQLKRFSAFEKPIAISRQARNLLLSSASKTMSNEIFETYPAASSNPNPRYTSIPAHDAVYDSTSKRWFLKTTESGQKDSASQTEPWQNLRETIEDSGESGLNPGSRDEEVKQQRMNLFLLNASGPGPANQASYPNSDHHILLSDCVGISGTNDFEYPLKLDYNENDTSLGICKDLDLDTFACGKLFLGPFREKGIQRECGDTMLFYIIQGHIKVSINNNLYNLSQGDCFCVPPGNPYNITNSLNFPAILFFTQLKHPDVNQ
uniref:Mif2/CENP-C cupin domain-containing protein n=1 Tax=Callorhinchus milii TaxID=7868 RepID=A0A4W3HF60_CALMI